MQRKRRSQKAKASIRRSANTPKTAGSRADRDGSWTCPKCLKRFAKLNQHHMCERVGVEEVASVTTPELEEVLKRLIAFTSRLPGCQVSTSKKAVTFSLKVAFAFVHPKPRWLDLCLFLSEAPDDPRLKRVTSYSKKRLACFLRLHEAEEYDSSVNDLLVRAHATAQPQK